MSDRSAETLSQVAARARSWVVGDALPFWLAHGYDEARGGFFETTDFRGVGNADAKKRVRVQARQIYVFSHAHVLGWNDGALERARRGVDYLIEKAWTPGGGWAHLLMPDGAIADAKHDAYDHAFVLLALGWYYRASGDARARAWIGRTLDFMDETLWDAAGLCWFEDDRHSVPRRQNPHMHLLESFMALYEATGEAVFLERARAMVTLFGRHFFRKQTGTLCEFMTDDWVPAPGAEGRIVEPGHHYEWVWLLSEYQRLSGAEFKPQREALFSFAQRFGIEPRTGLIYDALLDDGSIHQASKRCWPQTEALRALIARRRDGENVEAQTATVTANLLDLYLKTEIPGLWQDQFGPANEPLAKTVPASSLYHIFGAFVPLLAG